MKYVLILIGLILMPPASAQVYSCPDGRGGKTYQQSPCSGSNSGYVRCIKANGDSYIYRGATCPVRHESIPQRPGMFTNVQNGQQTFMIPGGGNGMIDPATGQRHELISPPQTRRIQDQAESVSQQDACQQDRIKRDQALSSRNRSIDSIRAAEAKYARLGCK